jgi:maltose alpha-D-glucosyltransferase / alpha-amylase
VVDAAADRAAQADRAFGRGTRSSSCPDNPRCWRIAFGDRLVLKVIRKLEPGRNPDLEIGRFLTEVARFEHTAPVVGALEYRTQGRDRWREGAALAVLQGFVPNEGDAWRYTLDFLSRFFERVVARGDAALPIAVRRAAEAGAGHPLEVALAARRMSEEEALAEASTLDDTEDEVQEIVGLYPTQAALLGRRTAELHLALSGALASAAEDDPAFAPEAFGELYQRSLYQSMRASTGKTFRLLRRSLKRLPEELRPEAEELLGRRQALLERFGALRGGKIEALRTRTHGDYHLGQVLWTGKDFRIIDFEGEPARPLSERRIKRSPLRDVAGMLRSFDYAVHAALRELVERGIVAADQLDALGLWGRLWYQESAAAFLRAYLETAEGSRIVPADEDHLRPLLDAYLLDKAIYELRYELDNRPAWAGIALRGILGLIGDS